MLKVNPFLFLIGFLFLIEQKDLLAAVILTMHSESCPPSPRLLFACLEGVRAAGLIPSSFYAFPIV